MTSLIEKKKKSHRGRYKGQALTVRNYKTYKELRVRLVTLGKLER